MPELSNELKENSMPASRKPAIRTMKSDAEELFKSSRPSLMDMVTQETSSPAYPAARAVKHFSPLYFALGAIALVIMGAGIYFIVLPPAAPLPQIKLAPPSPFFAVEASRTVTIDAKNRVGFLQVLEDSYREAERLETFKRIAVKMQDGPEERFLTMADLADLLRMSPPRALLERVSGPAMIFFQATEEGNRFGLAVKTSDPDRIFLDMLSWENSILVDLRNLFFDAQPESSIVPFEDRTYRNIDWRFQKLSTSIDLGIGYTVFPAKNLLVITTSRDSMETAINRLFDAR